MPSRRSTIQEAAKTQKVAPNRKLTRRPEASESEEQKQEQKQEKKPAIPVRSAGMKTLQFMLVIVGFAAALVIGMAVGYSVLGHGSISDVLYPETWAHIFQLVYAS